MNAGQVGAVLVVLVIIGFSAGYLFGSAGSRSVTVTVSTVTTVTESTNTTEICTPAITMTYVSGSSTTTSIITLCHVQSSI